MITIPPMVSVFTKGIGWVDESVASSAPVSAAYNIGIYYYPIILPASCTVRRLWWANGAAVANNYEVAIYADDGDHKPGALIVSSGATAQSGTNSVQFVDTTDVIIGPGLYWLAGVASASGGQLFRAAADIAGAGQAAFVYGDGTASNPLPATADPVETTSSAIYLFGFSTVTSP